MKIDIYCHTCGEFLEREIEGRKAYEVKTEHKESNTDHTVNYC